MIAWGQSNSRVGRTFALGTADPGSILGTPKWFPECRVRSNLRAPPGVVHKQKQSKTTNLPPKKIVQNLISSTACSPWSIIKGDS